MDVRLFKIVDNAARFESIICGQEIEEEKEMFVKHKNDYGFHYNHLSDNVKSISQTYIYFILLIIDLLNII